MGVENPARIEQAKVDVPLGANVLVGITYVEPDGSDSHVQVHGRIVEIASTGILIECAGTRIGKTLELPPDPGIFVPAPAGDYRLRTTGEIVPNPDFTAMWTVYRK